MGEEKVSGVLRLTRESRSNLEESVETLRTKGEVSEGSTELERGRQSKLTICAALSSSSFFFSSLNPLFSAAAKASKTSLRA